MPASSTGVVLIHVQIPGRLRAEIESAVLGEQLQHVIEETDARADAVPPCPSMVSRPFKWFPS